jgi:hypothetical protein
MHMQARKENELAQLRTAEESQLASAVLSHYSEAQRERGEIADLHSKHDVLRECAPHIVARVLRALTLHTCSVSPGVKRMHHTAAVFLATSQ